MLWEGVSSSQLLVQVDAEARTVIRPQRSVADLRTAGEHFARSLAELVLLLDAEVVAGQIQLQVHRVADRRDVAGTVPGSPHAKELAQRRELASHAQSADIRNVDSDEIDESLFDERHILRLIH